MSLHSQGLDVCLARCLPPTSVRAYQTPAPQVPPPVTSSPSFFPASPASPPCLACPQKSLPAERRIPAVASQKGRTWWLRASHSPPNISSESHSHLGRTRRHRTSPCQALPSDLDPACPLSLNPATCSNREVLSLDIQSLVHLHPTRNPCPDHHRLL